jgi:hypothetical protein
MQATTEWAKNLRVEVRGDDVVGQAGKLARFARGVGLPDRRVVRWADRLSPGTAWMAEWDLTDVALPRVETRSRPMNVLDVFRRKGAQLFRQRLANDHVIEASGDRAITRAQISEPINWYGPGAGAVGMSRS